jgi:hypothetical protein
MMVSMIEVSVLPRHDRALHARSRRSGVVISVRASVGAKEAERFALTDLERLFGRGPARAR